jgi:hypothetical protein
MTASTIADAGIAIWQRTIDRRQKKLAPEAARALLNLHLAKHDLDRADALAAKRCEGRLTEWEEHELEAYRMVGTTMELLQSKARRALGISLRA